MNFRATAVAVPLLLATCGQASEPASTPTVESTWKGLGSIPASEVAVWQKAVGSSSSPTARYGSAVAFNPLTGRTCLFGGRYSGGQTLDDYWEWDGMSWTELATSSTRPPALTYAAMAFDPARKSMILFGGGDNDAGRAIPASHADTWELTETGSWVLLNPPNHPDARNWHGMVSDNNRNKILLFGGMTESHLSPTSSLLRDMNDVWEWDGAVATWTNRTPLATTDVPYPRKSPGLAYDEGRRRMFLYDGINYGQAETSFWEWDPVSGGWAARGTSDRLAQSFGANILVTYDSARRREVVLSAALSSSGVQETWEADTVGPTWYVRVLPVAPARSSGSLVFDSKRGVVVYVGSPGSDATGDTPIETWEYKVTGWSDGGPYQIDAAAYAPDAPPYPPADALDYPDLGNVGNGGAGGSSPANRDGEVGDAAVTFGREADWGCALGQPPASLLGSEPLAIAVGLALLLRRKRRRRPQGGGRGPASPRGVDASRAVR